MTTISSESAILSTTTITLKTTLRNRDKTWNALPKLSNLPLTDTHNIDINIVKGRKNLIILPNRSQSINGSKRKGPKRNREKRAKRKMRKKMDLRLYSRRKARRCKNLSKKPRSSKDRQTITAT